MGGCVSISNKSACVSLRNKSGNTWGTSGKTRSNTRNARGGLTHTHPNTTAHRPPPPSCARFQKQESKDKTDDGDKQGKEEEEEEDKGEEGKALEKREGKKKGKKWEASRDEWKAQEEAEPPEA